MQLSQWPKLGCCSLSSNFAEPNKEAFFGFLQVEGSILDSEGPICFPKEKIVTNRIQSKDKIILPKALVNVTQVWEELYSTCISDDRLHPV